MKLKLINYLGINIIYVCDISNYLYLSDLSVLNQINLDEDISADDFLHFVKRNYPEKLAEITHNINSIENLKNRQGTVSVKTEVKEKSQKGAENKAHKNERKIQLNNG